MRTLTLKLVSVVPENAIRFFGHTTHEHDCPHLVHQVTGEGSLLVDDERITLQSRESVWLDAHVPHSLRLSDGGMALGPMLSPTTRPATRIQRLGVVPSITAVMITVLGVGPMSAEEVAPFRIELDRVLGNLARSPFPVLSPSHPVARSIARDAERSRATLDELASLHSLSVRHVQRLFLEETGMPFSRWRTRVRLNAAVRRLHGGADIASAARSVGYATRGGLLRALSRESGTTVEDLAADPLASLG